MKELHSEPHFPGNGLDEPPAAGPAQRVNPFLRRILDSTARRFRVRSQTAQFAMISVTIAVIIAGVVIWRIDNSVTEVLLAQGAARVMDQAQLAIRDHVTAADFEPPYTQTKLDDLSARLSPLLTRARQRSSGVLRVNLFARDGTVVYSDMASLRGQAVSPVVHAPLAQALAGSIAADISALATLENSGLRSFSDSVLEAYVPFRLNGQVVGAYEVYIDLMPTRPTRLLIGAAVAGGFLLLVLAMLAAARLIFGPFGRVALADTHATGVLETGPSAARTLAMGYPLTRREVEVLRLMATNRSYAQIAAELIVSEETVRTHVRSIFHKLGQTDRAHAVAAAVEARIV